ncbi:helix-turn-helix domain-containing protein [Chryseobacterium hagamense]|uniref:Transcriptional regulator n=1 Tax=Chryseobacterium hagamense TaxID=395935 RepID=A0A511YHL9_9FLAO|nr:helix-turn-helix transcriptional regulator [Chryseobacterium hagamense]GEN74694.1 transcriptional regulator [Chryseobacterium hagamense]
MSLNERISKVIEYSGLTPSEFADEIDVQRSSISHITSGRNKPSLEFIIKIKSRFPELLWDWLVTGEGEMLKSELPEEKPVITEPVENSRSGNPKPASLPDLFDLMSRDENSAVVQPEINEPESGPRESFISSQGPAQQDITDSQASGKSNDQIINQAIDNQQSKIKRIVIFYDNGKFESFEP